MENNNFKKILVIHPWGIGDLIMFTPALKAVRENLPKSQIDLLILGRPHVAEVLESSPIISRIINFNWKERGFFERVKLIRSLRREKYDLSLVTGLVNPLRGGVLSLLTGSRMRAGTYDKKSKALFYNYKIPRTKGRHLVEINLDLVSSLGFKLKERPEVFCQINEASRNFAKNLIESQSWQDKILIGFHPGAEKVHSYLLWPKEYFIKLGREISNKFENARIIIFGGPDEKELCREIKKEIGESAFLATDFSLGQTMALISCCRVFVASDSGLGHLASATGVNLISIFGPSEPQLYAPWGSKVRVLKSSCRHLYRENYEHDCLKRITPGQVFEEISKILIIKQIN